MLKSGFQHALSKRSFNPNLQTGFGL